MGKAAAFLGAAAVGSSMFSSGNNSYDCTFKDDCDSVSLGALIYLSSWIWSQIDAPISAASINRRRRGLAVDLRPMPTVVRGSQLGVSVLRVAF